MIDELDRYQPDDWSPDGVTTVRRRSERQFRKRKENWLAVAAKATMVSFAVATLTSATTLALPASDLVQRAAFADVSRQARPHSELRNVEAAYWPRLLKFLDQFPRDETVKNDFDPDPFT